MCVCVCVCVCVGGRSFIHFKIQINYNLFIKLDTSSVNRKKKEERKEKKARNIVESFIPFLTMYLRLYDLILYFSIQYLLSTVILHNKEHKGRS